MRIGACKLCSAVGARHLEHRRQVILTSAHLRLLCAIALIAMVACTDEVTDDVAPQTTSFQQVAATPEMPLSQLFVPVRDAIQDLEPLCGPFPDDARWRAEKFPVTLQQYKDFLYPEAACWPMDSLQIRVRPASDSKNLGALEYFIYLERINDMSMIDEVAGPIAGILVDMVYIDETDRDEIGRGLYQQIHEPKYTEGKVCYRMVGGQSVAYWCEGDLIPVKGVSSLGVRWEVLRVDQVVSVWLRVQR